MKVYLKYGDGQVEGPIEDVETFNRRSSEIAQEYGSVEIERADVICDFCSWPRVSWTFSILPGGEMYTVMEPGKKSEHHIDRDGLWAACSDCKDFIMAGDWDGLLERSVRHADSLLTPMKGLPEPLIRTAVRQAHGHFVERYDGREPIPMEDDDDFLRSVGIEEFNFDAYKKGFQS